MITPKSCGWVSGESQTMKETHTHTSLPDKLSTIDHSNNATPTRFPCSMLAPLRRDPMASHWGSRAPVPYSWQLYISTFSISLSARNQLHYNPRAKNHGIQSYYLKAVAMKFLLTLVSFQVTSFSDAVAVALCSAHEPLD